MKMSRNLLTCFLATLVFLTSTGMTVNLHFCANNIQSVSLENHQGCAMTNKATFTQKCATDSKASTLKKSDSCCKNQQIKAKQPVKSADQQEKCSAKTLAFIQSYFSNLFSFEDDAEDEDKPEQSLFPLLKEGLYILLSQFRN